MAAAFLLVLVAVGGNGGPSGLKSWRRRGWEDGHPRVEGRGRHGDPGMGGWEDGRTGRQDGRVGG